MSQERKSGDRRACSEHPVKRNGCRAARTPQLRIVSPETITNPVQKLKEVRPVAEWRRR